MSKVVVNECLACSHVSLACSQRTAFPRQHPPPNLLEEEEAVAMTKEVQMMEVKDEVVEVEEEMLEEVNI